MPLPRIIERLIKKYRSPTLTEIIEEVAKNHNMTPQAVHKEIEKVIRADHFDPDPAVREHWEKLASTKTSKRTAEENLGVLIYLLLK